ncbi:cell wall-binding repeat-containing protein [Herbiconiux sp. P15]|uniref:cell wall-binding repeat-containing protein n=1 Tax=Herbiconiux liukaitaii TaxID=3342799 RepID=UPI0035BA1D0A
MRLFSVIVSALLIATQLVGTSAEGVPADGSFADPSVSADGRFVAFSSDSYGLTPISPQNSPQVYVKDTATGAVTLVSTSSSDPSVAGSGSSLDPSISADGRFVAFTSFATDLDPTVAVVGYRPQIYVRDLASGGTTKMLSADHTGTTSGNGRSESPAISADGRSVAFHSTSTNLVDRVLPSEVQVYVADVSAAPGTSTAVVSLQDYLRYPTPELANGASFDPSISADGQRISFTSVAENLVADRLPAGRQQVFVHSRADGSTRLVSQDRSGSGGGDGNSVGSTISADGSTVAFSSAATNVTSIPLAGGVSAYQILVRRLDRVGAVLASAARRTGAGGDGASGSPSLSSDGRFVAFESSASDLALVRSGSTQVYVRDLMLARTQLVSGVSADPLDGGGLPSEDAVISASGRSVTFVSRAAGLSSIEVPDSSPRVYQRPIPGPGVERLGGADRFEVSASVSARTFPPGVDVAYVATGATYADALSGGAAAGVEDAPVLLVRRGDIPAAVQAELTRLEPAQIVILGGTASVDDSVERALGEFSPTVSRLGGADRYEVSAAVSRETFATGSPVAYIASGQVFPDALSGSAVAGRQGGPVLLVTRDGVPPAVQAELARLAPAKVVVLGGPASVSDAVVAAVGGTRIGGADRYEVSAALTAGTSAPPVHTVFVASGAVFPDALSGSAAAVVNGSPVLLVRRDEIPAAVAAQLDRLDPHRIVVLGGPDTVSEATATALEAFVTP